MNKVYLQYKMRSLFLPHYLIIGKYSDRPIGCTCGESVKKEVCKKELGSTFKRIQRRECPICADLRGARNQT